MLRGRPTSSGLVRSSRELPGCIGFSRPRRRYFFRSAKKLQFFDDNYARGWRWYRSFFDHSNGRLTGEFSPQYVHNARAISRLLQCPESTRFIVSLREPADRAYSHFIMDQRDSGLSAEENAAEFDRVARRPGNKYVACSDYRAQLQPLLARTALDRLQVVWFADIRERPLEVIDALERFLKCPLGIDRDSLPERTNPAKSYRSVGLFRTLQAGVRLTERMGFDGLVDQAKRHGLNAQVLRLLEKPEAYRPMLPSTRRFLDDRFADEPAALAGLLGQSVRW